MGTINNTPGSNNFNKYSVSKSDKLVTYQTVEADADFTPGDNVVASRNNPEDVRTFNVVTDGMLYYFDAFAGKTVTSFSGVTYNVPSLDESGSIDPSGGFRGVLWNQTNSVSGQQQFQPAMQFFCYNMDSSSYSPDGGGSIIFDGIDDWGYAGISGQPFVYNTVGITNINTQSEASINAPWPSSGTLSQWIKSEKDGGFPFMVTGGPTEAKDGGNGWGYGMQTHNLANRVGMYFGRGYVTSGNYADAYTTNSKLKTSILENQWYELTTTWTEGGYVYAYIDGELVYSKDISDVEFLPWPPNSYVLGAARRASSEAARIARSLQGKMATLFIYGRPLSASEVKQNYLALKDRYPKTNIY